MDFDPNDDEKQVRELAARIFREAGVSDDRALWSEIAAAGLLGILAPAEAGGVGMGPVAAALAVEEAGYMALAAPFRVHLLATKLLRDGEWLDRALAGKAVLGVVEDAGFVEWGHVLDAIVNADGSVVPISVSARRRRPVMDEGAPVAAINPAIASSFPSQWFPLAATLTAAEMLGAARRCLDLSVAHAAIRKQFGQPIGSFQAVRHLCADMLVDVENMRRLIYAAAWSIEAQAPEARVWAAMAKSETNVMARRVWTNSMQVHGGIGFTWEYPLHRVAKRAEALISRFGSARSLREQIGANYISLSA